MSKVFSSKYFFILGNPVSKKIVYLSISGLLLVIAITFGVFFLSLPQRISPSAKAQEAITQCSYSDKEATSSQESESKEEQLALHPSPTTIRQLLENHLIASGQMGLKNYMLVGTFGDINKRDKLLLKALAPNHYKFRTNYIKQSVEIEFGYNGDQVWLRKNTNHLQGDNLKTFKTMALMESSLSHLAWCFQSLEAEDNGLDSILELRPEEKWKGRNYYVLRSRNLLPIEINHYIDKGTYLEVYRTTKLLRPSGSTSTVHIEYDQPDRDAEYRIPMGYRIFLDNELHDTVKFDKLKVNQVVLQTIFNPPNDY